MPADHTSPGLILDVKPPAEAPRPGEWLLIPADRWAHYFPPGAARCLCAEHRRTRRTRPLALADILPSGHRYRYKGWAKYVPHCGRCAALNFARWAAAGSAPNGGG